MTVEEKNPRFFHFFSVPFVGVLKIKCLSKCPHSKKPCLPWKIPGSAPARCIFVKQISTSLMTSQWHFIFIVLFFHCSHGKVFCCNLLFLCCYYVRGIFRIVTNYQLWSFLEKLLNSFYLFSTQTLCCFFPVFLFWRCHNMYQYWFHVHINFVTLSFIY